MPQLHIAPSLIAADFTRLGEHIREAEEAGAQILHIDVMDGRFVPNITIGPLLVEAARRVRQQMELDVHLMIVEPERYLEAFAKAGADRITVHYEVSPNLHRTLSRIRELGCKAGVALNPHTPARALSEIMHLLDQINVMTVNPGFGGQAFLPETMHKVAELRAMIGTAQRPIDLEVDGGINAETASAAVQSGANVLVMGSAFFGTGQPLKQAYAAIMDALES